MINNDQDSVFTEPCLLIPPIDNDFTCTDFTIDDVSDSETTVPCNEISNDVPRDLPPPEPPPACVPEITFTSISPMLKESWNNPPTSYVGCHSLNYVMQPLKNEDNVCDCAMQANALLSSIVTHDDKIPLLFRDKTNDDIEKSNLLIKPNLYF